MPIGRILDQTDLGPGGPLPRRPLSADSQLDITPMIDVTFLLLIFFLVASVPELQAALEWPPAQYGIGVSRREASPISIAGPDGGVRIYLSEKTDGRPLSGDEAEQAAAVRTAVEAGLRDGKNEVLIRAERRLRHGDVARIVDAASIEGVKVNLAVLELR